MNKIKKTTLLWFAVLLVGGFILGHIWTKAKYAITEADGFNELEIAYERIINNYLNGADERALIEGAIDGMVKSLDDPYSTYHPQEKGEQYADSYESSFYGVGAVIKDNNGKFTIESVYKEMPAEKSGLRANDIIIAVDGQSAEGLTLLELVNKVKGEKDTDVTITVLRDNTELSFTMTRAEIPVYTVESEMLENNLGYINILNFAQETDVEFIEALNKLEQQGMQALILDLRSNPGGLVEQAKNIADVLVPKGHTIYEIVFKDEKRHISYPSEQKKPFDKEIIVLVNEYSASASELIAAALKESAGAEIIGTKTFGKGVVQVFQQFNSGSVLVLTEAQWRTPNGSWINGEGVEPTKEVKLPEYAYYLPITASRLLLNDSGEQVSLLKNWLSAIGYAQTDSDQFDQTTEEAIKAIQAKNNLEVTGMFDQQLGGYIYSEVAKLLESNDTQLDAAIKEATN